MDTAGPDERQDMKMISYAWPPASQVQQPRRVTRRLVRQEPRPRRRRRPGPSGEQGPNACDTCSVFPASGGVAGHDEVELELECDAAAPPATTSSKGK